MNFNWEIYRALNPDLNFSSPKDYLTHFQKYGIKQRRLFSVYNIAKKFNSKIYKFNYIDLHNLNEIQLHLHYILIGQYQLRIYNRIIKPIDGSIFDKKLEDSTYFDFIDKIFYINLDSRTDRLKEITNEFEWTNIPNDKIERFSAIKHDNGAIGCTLSHIACLKKAIELNLNNVLILEDDFNFKHNKFFIKETLNHIKNLNENEWDVILFAGNIKKTQPFNLFLDKAIEIQTTAGYLVNKNYFNKLLSNYEEGLKLLKLTNCSEKYAIDMYWKSLQAIDKWYITQPSIGYQRVSYSDIEGRLVNYKC